MSIEEKRRAAFEAAYPFSDLYVFVCERYICGRVRPSAADREGVERINEAWFYWNAALDSAVVNLRGAQVFNFEGDPSGRLNGKYVRLDDMLRAAGEAGVKVSP